MDGTCNAAGVKTEPGLALKAVNFLHVQQASKINTSVGEGTGFHNSE